MTQTPHTASSKEARGSGCIDANAGQKVTVFYEMFQIFFLFFSHYVLKQN